MLLSTNMLRENKVLHDSYKNVFSMDNELLFRHIHTSPGNKVCKAADNKAVQGLKWLLWNNLYLNDPNI